MFSEPRARETEVPSPISTAFTAPMDMTAPCESGVQLVKYGISEAGGDAVRKAFHHAAGGILPLHALLQICLCPAGCLRVRHAERIIADLFFAEALAEDGPDAFRIGADPDAEPV